MLKFSINIFLQRLKLGIPNLVRSLDFSRPIIKRVKSGRGPGLGELPNIWGFPLIFLQQMKIATSRLADR